MKLINLALFALILYTIIPHNSCAAAEKKSKARISMRLKRKKRDKDATPPSPQLISCDPTAYAEFSLFKAIKKSPASLIDVYLGKNPSAVTQLHTTYGHTPLYAALLTTPDPGVDTTGIIKVLLKHQANPYQENTNNKSAFTLALQNNNRDIIELFQNNSLALPIAQPITMPLHTTAALPIAQQRSRLQKSYALPSLTLFKAVNEGHSLEKIKEFVMADLELLKRRPSDGYNILHWIARYGQGTAPGKKNMIRKAALMLELKANPHALSRDRKTPLQIAQKENYAALIELLTAHNDTEALLPVGDAEASISIVETIIAPLPLSAAHPAYALPLCDLVPAQIPSTQSSPGKRSHCFSIDEFCKKAKAYHYPSGYAECPPKALNLELSDSEHPAFSSALKADALEFMPGSE